MEGLDVVVFTSDKYLWCLRPFAYLFNKYWSESQKVIVAGYSRPEFDLPVNFEFRSIAPVNYPAEQWVDGAQEFFRHYTPERFVFMHEDYWLTRKVDTEAVDILNRYCADNANVFRMDLTKDRLYAGGMKDVFYVDRFDIVEAVDSPYQCSHQAAIFNTSLYLKMLSCLRWDQHSPWEVEMGGTTIINSYGSRMRVLGTRQFPVRYCNALLKGDLDWEQLPGMTDDDYNEIVKWIPIRLLNKEKE